MSSPRLRTSSLITWLTTSLVAVIIIASPASYFAVSYQRMLGEMDSSARSDSHAIARIVTANPELWEFETLRLLEVLNPQGTQSAPESRLVFTLEGELAAEVDAGLSPPLISRTADILDSGEKAGEIVVLRSGRKLVWRTLLVFLGALPLGAATFIVIRVIPVRLINRSEERLLQSEQKYRDLFEYLSDAAFLVDFDTWKILDTNRQATVLLNRPRAEIVGIPLDSLHTPAAAAICRRELMRSEELVVVTLDSQLAISPTSHIPVHISGRSVSMLGNRVLLATYRDITKQAEAEARIRFMAYHDQLTGLPNATYLRELLDKMTAVSKRSQQVMAVMFCDLDGFKHVNDTLGHSVGDELLRQVSRRLLGVIRGSDSVARSDDFDDTVSRMGGDEFIFAFTDLTTAGDAGAAAQRILDALGEPFHIAGAALVVGASIGITVCPGDGSDTETLLKNADAAMYRAKNEGKNTYRFFSQELNKASLKKMTMATDMRKAIEDHRFVAYYQPIVSTATRQTLGHEALIRWEHETRGMISPDAFVPLAEQTGLIVPTGMWILKEACLQGRRWIDAALPGQVSVNISSQQLEHDTLLREIADALRAADLPPEHLALEIAESTLMRNPKAGLALLAEIRTMGVRVGIDDFGTGYSSLSDLQRIPVDTLKIDHSFLRAAADEGKDREILAAIIALAHSMGMEVVCKGVETEDQAAILSSVGCDRMQGFLFGKPLPADEITSAI